MRAVTRRYGKCSCGEPSGSAVDAVLGIESRFSKRVQKHACRLAADTSFLATSEHRHEWLDGGCAARRFGRGWKVTAK